MNRNPHSNNVLLNLGIQSLNQMQEVAQNAILNENNVLLLSPTGSGKTLAFLLPILQMLEEDIKGVQCVILVPSRELGLQIEQVWKKMATHYKVNMCYGGHNIDVEINNLSNPPALLIGTPGRIADKQNTNLNVRIVFSKSKDKIESLFQLICSLKSESAIVFCNHREAVERIHDMLTAKGIISTFYHGGLDQDERERALIQFRNGSVSYLITTDLGARGLDIPEMNHVIHYHLPAKEDEFTHRNGRTARMLATGTAYVLIHETEKKADYFDYGTRRLDVSDAKSLPKAPEFQTLYISGGKKNKINKVDILGFFSQKGELEKGDIGLIEVKDFISFAAVKYSKVKDLLKKISDQKMKGKKYKIEVARKVIKKEEEEEAESHPKFTSRKENNRR